MSQTTGIIIAVVVVLVVVGGIVDSLRLIRISWRVRPGEHWVRLPNPPTLADSNAWIEKLRREGIEGHAQHYYLQREHWFWVEQLNVERAREILRLPK